MRMRVLAGFLLLAIPGFAETGQCESNPKLVGACHEVHRRATFGPGTPSIRIWQIGTKHILGVTAGPIADDADMPICPKEMLKFKTGDEEVYADFEVCPFTPERAGKMQMVCVQSMQKLFVKRPVSKN